MHGYHPWTEDAEIYVPGVEKILQPELFPVNSQFFEAHAHSTLFPNLIAALVRLTHLPLSVVLFVGQLACIFLLLLACWQLAGRCFADSRARWAGVALMAALLTLPVAGTALYILDQYLNPRNLAAFPAIYAIVKVLDKKYLPAGLFLVFTAVIHPLMSVFAIYYCVLLVAMREFTLPAASLAAMLPFGLSLDPPPKAYHLIALTHPFHYITRWQWYELVGAVAPFFILWCFSRLARSTGMGNVDLICRTLIVYELLCLPPALVLSSFRRFESLARLQPTRSYFLLYILMFLLIGCFLGQYVLKDHVWRWLVLFVPLCAGMFIAQRELFPASAHIEWPGAAPKNPWVQAFVWVRGNTPTDAVFAMNPQYLDLPGADEQGFRDTALRSRIADNVRDSGAVSMFPAMTNEWYRQLQAQQGWKNFQRQDLLRLQADFGVSWVVLQQPGIGGLDCPYQNQVVLVCRIE